MGLLPKYQKGKKVGFDPADIPKEINNLGDYEGVDISDTSWTIEESQGYKHNINVGEGRSNSRSILRAASPTNNKIFDQARVFDKSKSDQTAANAKEIVDGRWHNFRGDDGRDSLKKGSKVKVGSATITVSGAYGIRNLKGRKQEHSRGMDITTSTGKAHALQDGVIESVKLQGSGKTVTTSDTPAAGYYITVKNADGSRTQYMHLDPMTATDMKNLSGKKIKRGEEIWGYTTGSGSMTNPHVKIRHYGNSSRYNVDPSQLLQGIAYKFIPNATGGNMFQYKKGGRLLNKK